jgi:hypothetical protein
MMRLTAALILELVSRMDLPLREDADESLVSPRV